MAQEDELRTLEFSFSGVTDRFDGERPGREIAEMLNSEREYFASRIEEEIMDVLSGPAYAIRRERGPERLVEVEIHFRDGSLLWDGWVVVHDAKSYLGDTVLNDAAIVGGLVALIDPLRKIIGKCVDLVVRESIWKRWPSADPRTRTRVIIATPVVGSTRVLKRLDDLEREMEAIRNEGRHQRQMSIAIATIAVLLTLLIASLLEFVWYVRLH